MYDFNIYRIHTPPYMEIANSNSAWEPRFPSTFTLTLRARSSRPLQRVYPICGSCSSRKNGNSVLRLTPAFTTAYLPYVGKYAVEAVAAEGFEGLQTRDAWALQGVAWQPVVRSQVHHFRGDCSAHYCPALFVMR